MSNALNGKVTRSDVDGHRAIIWHGYDGKQYVGNLMSKVHGIIRLCYIVPGVAELAIAFVDTKDRNATERIELA